MCYNLISLFCSSSFLPNKYRSYKLLACLYNFTISETLLVSMNVYSAVSHKTVKIVSRKHCHHGFMKNNSNGCFKINIQTF